ncbi:hypothetical protein H1164_03725 [Thermoactinomyces daqus]|uniref:Uncharacterized protein n=1 Tax=Thermoactinomyces daqus TaxID=1329516 RepID=A0A7W2AHB8_9BACL|nr:hypothetical protein [Thermoactinomyces daqus]MBA4542010.1 hypothetical protein [Thermoactinomyces daqus]
MDRPRDVIAELVEKIDRNHSIKYCEQLGDLFVSVKMHDGQYGSISRVCRVRKTGDEHADRIAALECLVKNLAHDLAQKEAAENDKR